MVTARRRRRLRASIQIELVKYFCAGVTARSAAELTGINRNSAMLFFHKLREVIFEQLALETPELFGGEIEVDESYFGGTRKGKRGRGAAGKVPVFGLLKRNGRVYVAIIPNVSSGTLFPIIRDKIRPDSIVYTDSFRSYDALDISEFQHVRINHSELFADQVNHINGIENFWNQANNRPVANLAKLLSKWWLK
jgi:transposase